MVGGRVDDGRRRVHAQLRGRETKSPDANTRSPQNSTPTTMDELDHTASRKSSSDTEDDEDVEMLSLEEITMTPQKDTHPLDHGSESSDDEDDAEAGLLASGPQRRAGHAHKRSLSLSKGINIWQQ